MRIPAHPVLLTGQDKCPEFDLCPEPLPKELSVLLCLLDGAEGRRQLQAKLNRLNPCQREEKSISISRDCWSCVLINATFYGKLSARE